MALNVMKGGVFFDEKNSKKVLIPACNFGNMVYSMCVVGR